MEEFTGSWPLGGLLGNGGGGMALSELLDYSDGDSWINDNSIIK